MPKARKGDKRSKRSKWIRNGKRTASMAVTGANEILEGCIARIPNMALADLPTVIDEARKRCNCKYQEKIVYACLQRILAHGSEASAARVPRTEQVRTLRRLIFGRSDVLLIARTGFGKSLIFHAYSILTGKITLQLVPLSKLGDEQLDDIRRLDGARPCLIDSKNKAAEKKLLAKVGDGQYTHVLLGPEQASSRSFRKALKNPELQARIGLVAIDECHLVLQWEKFRPAFTLLGELRTILRADIVWFGCSATLDSEAEKRVIDTAGFRSAGNGMYQTEVIRTSVDRPDVSLSVIPLPRKKLNSWDILYFLLTDAVHGGCATPQQVPKTIVFIDGRHSVHAAATWARNMLLAMSKSLDPAQRYTTSDTTPERNVFEVVKVYTAGVSQFDRDATYKEFAKPSSVCRIIFATTSLGMGVNIPDVERVVTWKIPITKSLADLWQRLGRGGRGPGRTSSGYVFLPYWMFDSQGCYKNGSKPSPSTLDRGNAITKPKRIRNQLPSNRAKARSRLSQCMTPGDLSDADGETQHFGLPDLVADLDPNDEGSTRQWTKADMTRRDDTPPDWMRMVNGICHRQGFLLSLGEHKLHPSERQAVDKVRCCSKCNRSLLPSLPSPPDHPKPPSPPRSGTLAAFMVASINQWAAERALLLFGGQDMRFSLPPGVYLEQTCRWELGVFCAGIAQDEPLPTLVADDTNSQNSCFDVLCSGVPSLSNWELRNTESGHLMEMLPAIVNRGKLQHKEYRDEKKACRAYDKASLPVTKQQPDGPRDTDQNVDRTAANRRRDDELADRVAVYEAISAKPPPLVEPPTGLSVSACPATPSAREFVDAIIASPNAVVPIPASTPNSVRQYAEQLINIRRQFVLSPTRPACPSSGVDDAVRVAAAARERHDVRDPVTPSMKRHAITRSAPSREQSTGAGTPSARFAGYSSRGRERILSRKAEENRDSNRADSRTFQ